MKTLKFACLGIVLALPLAAALIAPSSLPAMAQAPSAAQRQADITFWTSIKDSKNPEEYKAYLQAFPTGIFAPLAKLRMRQLAQSGGQNAGTSPPGPAVAAPAAPPAAAPRSAPGNDGPPPPESGPPAADAPSSPPPRSASPASPPADPPVSPPPPRVAGAEIDYTSRTFLTVLQEKLYNLNYDIEKVTGVFDRDTYKAIVAVQRNLKAPQTGELTARQWQLIQRARPSTVWAAIAYNANATHSFVFQRATRREAEDAAKASCRRRAGRNAKCSLMAAKDNQCIALAKYRERWGSNTYFGVRVYRAGTIERAREKAIEQCEQVDRSRGKCTLVRDICANGSHQQ